MNSKDTHNVIFSQESQDGHTPLNSPDIQQTDLFGQEVALASLSQPQGNKKAKKMNATSGLYGSSSYESAALQLSLESKLAQQLPMDGWMKSRMTWKKKVTPLGRQYCQLAVSVRRTSETDCGLWPTPEAKNHCGYQKQKDGSKIYRLGAKEIMPAMWPTPRAFCYKDAKTDRGKSNLGEIVNSFNALTESKGSLNPEFVYWLMGFPKEWVCSVQQGMQLCPKSPRSSSKRSKKV